MVGKIKNMERVISLLKKEVKRFKNPVATEVGERTRSPFQVLVSCILSLRTRDTITGPVSRKLFEEYDTPKKIADMPLQKLHSIIRPVNYYKTKGKRIKVIARELLKSYGGKVPANFEELMKFKGVGRKTASIVMVYGHFSKDHIPVDIHCHRVPNRLGWIRTKKPEQTEGKLKRIIPKKHWMNINDLFVMHGQNICTPTSPKCSECYVNQYCEKVGVKNSR